ncbi:MAG: MATE family efflux transporter [Angelakisella sp.]
MQQAKKPIGMTDMTTGSPLRLIFFFSLPLLAGNLFQQLYNMVDSMVVGRYVGDAALAAVGTGFPIFFMLSSLFMGVGSGATIIVSQYYGAGDMAGVRKTVDTIYTGMMVGSIPLTISGLLLSGPILHLIRVPADAFPMAHLYLLIIFGGVMGTLGFNINSGILQGLGDSKTPLIFLSIACVINVVLDLGFVLIFDWGVAGVALATIIAQFFSWIYGTIYINKKYPEIKVHPFSMHFCKHTFAKLMKLGIPIGVQQALFAVGIMALQALVNSYGSDFMAGFNGANKLDTFVFMPIQSFATAATTFVGQNIGANRMERVDHGTKVAIKLSMWVSVGVGILLLLGGRAMMHLFSPSPAVIDAGWAYLVRIVPFYWMLACLFLLNSIMRGAGDIMVPMLSSILSLWLARVPSAYLLDHFFGRDNMFFCYLFGWIVGLAITLTAYLRGNWRKKCVITRPAEASPDGTAPEVLP